MLQIAEQQALVACEMRSKAWGMVLGPIIDSTTTAADLRANAHTNPQSDRYKLSRHTGQGLAGIRTQEPSLALDSVRSLYGMTAIHSYHTASADPLAQARLRPYFLTNFWRRLRSLPQRRAARLMLPAVRPRSSAMYAFSKLAIANAFASRNGRLQCPIGESLATTAGADCGSPKSISGASESTTSRWIRFSSSRTFPGQQYVRKVLSACGES